MRTLKQLHCLSNAQMETDADFDALLDDIDAVNDLLRDSCIQQDIRAEQETRVDDNLDLKELLQLGANEPATEPSNANDIDHSPMSSGRVSFINLNLLVFVFCLFF